MNGHGQREAALLVDAINWKDRVINDLRSEHGRLSAREHQVSVKLISEVAALIAGYIAHGEVPVSPADTIRRALDRNELPISARQAGRVTKFLEARGHAAWLRACMLGETKPRCGQI
jgi:GTPase